MAGEYTLEINQGETKSIQVTYQDALEQPIDLTGYTGRGSIKLKATDATPLAAFVVTISDPTNGVVDIVLDADALEGAALKGKSYSEKTVAYYDIELVNGETVIRLLNGICNISPEITK